LLITTGIALNVTTPIFHSVENVTDVASHVLEAVETEEMEAVETVAVEISIEVPEIEETVVVETSTEVPEIEETEAAEMVVVEISIETPEAAAETVVVEREEITLAVMMTELSQERIISANQRVKEQDTPTTMHQNQLFHVNLIEIVMIK